MFGCRDMYAIRGNHVNYTCVQGVWMPTTKVVESGFNFAMYLQPSYNMELPACDKYCLPLTKTISDHSTLIPSRCSSSR